MGMLTRKQREKKEREELVLRVARELLLERGYLGLTMDRIAAQTEYSKGTIYQHFSCKEEVLMALSVRTLSLQSRLYERAAMFRGRPRERMLAVGIAAEMFLRLYPDDFRCCLTMRLSSIRDKTSPERQQQLKSREQRCMGVVSGIVRDAVASGDLELPGGVGPEAVCFALWSMTFGSHILFSTDIPLNELGISDPHGTVLRNGHAIMDGFGWKPLFSEWDYESCAKRIRQEVFADECAQV